MPRRHQRVYPLDVRLPHCLSSVLSSVAYTLAQTAKLHGRSVGAYLTWALERVAACEARPEGQAALTPVAYEEAQSVAAG